MTPLPAPTAPTAEQNHRAQYYPNPPILSPELAVAWVHQPRTFRKRFDAYNRPEADRIRVVKKNMPWFTQRSYSIHSRMAPCWWIPNIRGFKQTADPGPPPSGRVVLARRAYSPLKPLRLDPTLLLLLVIQIPHHPIYILFYYHDSLRFWSIRSCRISTINSSSGFLR